MVGQLISFFDLSELLARQLLDAVGVRGHLTIELLELVGNGTGLNCLLLLRRWDCLTHLLHHCSDVWHALFTAGTSHHSHELWHIRHTAWLTTSATHHAHKLTHIRHAWWHLRRLLLWRFFGCFNMQDDSLVLFINILLNLISIFELSPLEGQLGLAIGLVDSLQSVFQIGNRLYGVDCHCFLCFVLSIEDFNVMF